MADAFLSSVVEARSLEAKDSNGTCGQASCSRPVASQGCHHRLLGPILLGARSGRDALQDADNLQELESSLG